MAQLSYMFWMLVGGYVTLLLASVLVASLGILIIASFKKWRLVQKISAICLLVTILAGAAFLTNFILDPDPKEMFVSIFDRPVPANVQNLQFHRVWIGDTWVQWLRFETDENEFKKLLPPDLALANDPYSSFSRDTSGPNAPAWWKPKSENESAYYSLHRSPGKSFGGEWTMMTYNREDRCVYYYFCGVD